MDDFLSNFVLKEDEKELSDSKKDVMKFLKRIGVDTRFVSFFDDGDIKLYIENLRFSKFSKKRSAFQSFPKKEEKPSTGIILI